MKHLVPALSIIVLLYACKKEEAPETPTTSNTSYGSGVWVSCEGSFGNNNASIAFIADAGEVSNEAFFNTHSQPLGDVCQSAFVLGDRMFIAVNNSQKVEIVNRKTLARESVVTGCDYPRHFASDGDLVYLSNGALDGTVFGIEPASGDIAWQTSVGQGPERMAVSGTTLAVCNSGGWGTDNTVSLVNLNDQTVQAVTVGDRPVDVVVDAQGDFWVLCSGETQYDSDWNVTGHTLARLVEIDHSTFQVTTDWQVGEEGDHPSHLEINPGGSAVYHNRSGIERVDLSDGTTSTIASGNFYGLNIEPATGHLWAAPYPDFVSDGTVEVRDAGGALLETYSVGIAPNGVAFTD